MCVFYVFFMRLGTDFSHDFLLKIYFLASEKPNAGQNRFQKVTIFLLFFFSSACFFDSISPMFPQAFAKYF